MSEAKLSCCVVRDLLPSYIEELTEDETARLVKEHLDCCPECRRIESEMRSRIGIAPAPAPRLGFLRRYKRRQIISALLAAAAAIACIIALYFSEFKYPNTEAGRLLAAEEYAVKSASSASIDVNIPPLAVRSWAEHGGKLYIFYTAEDGAYIQGFVQLERGINGRYRAIRASVSPSQSTAGVSYEAIHDKNGRSSAYAVAAYNCRSVYSAELCFHVYFDSRAMEAYTTTIEITQPDSLTVFDIDALTDLLAAPSDAGAIGLYSVKLFDADGNDVTTEYVDPTVNVSWSGGISNASTPIYILMVLVAALGIILVRFFLKKD